MSPASRSGNPAVRNNEATTVDLDARRQAVREAKGGAVIIKVDGEELHAAVEIPLEFMIAMGDLDLKQAVSYLFPDPADAERFLSIHPTLQDLELVMKDGYGIDLGEASGSPALSMRNGSPLRPISSDSTG